MTTRDAVTEAVTILQLGRSSDGTLSKRAADRLAELLAVIAAANADLRSAMAAYVGRPVG